MMPRSLKNRFALLAVALAWVVGGAVALAGYLLLTQGVRREAFARVEGAIQMAWLVIDEEFDRMDPLRATPAMHEAMGVRRIRVSAEEALELTALRGLFQSLDWQGRSRGFVLLDESLSGGPPGASPEMAESLSTIRQLRGSQGLCMAFVVQERDGEGFSIALRPLRTAHALPDRIRDMAFGRHAEARHTATVTIFEGPVRIATNVRLKRAGTRAIGTTVSDAVARQVLVEGMPWKKRDWVVDRWVISRYDPILSADGEVIGMVYAGLDEAPYVAAGNRSIAIFTLSILVLAVLASGVAWWMGDRLARPLAGLTSAAEALARGERETLHVPATATREIAALGDAFNRMAAAVTEKADALEESRRRAQQALDDYMEVLGFVAHELKSPIAGALSQAALIESGHSGEVPEKLSRSLSAIRRYLDHGHEIALSFNELSRAETAGFLPRRQSVSDLLEEIVRPAVDDSRDAAQRNGMSIVIEGEPASLEADPDMIRTALDNLIGNAVKYGREGSEIRVALCRRNGAVRVEVRNEGMGVPRDRYPDLFRKFYRIHAPGSRTRKGTGVGLYLVKRIAELHGGTVGVEGEEGRWIRFWLDLPSSPESAKGQGSTPCV